MPYTLDVPDTYRTSQAGTYWRRDELRSFHWYFEDTTTGAIISTGASANTMTLDFEPNTVVADRPGQTTRDGDFAGVRVRQPTVQFGFGCDDRPKTAASIGVAAKRCRAVAESAELVADPLEFRTWPEARAR
ncbi:hypothetical protein GCM10009539_63860 [Cryptosporangium japonicum]|uniref:Uncharacterized protein n=2 Tax=Cryptosporangium japonicum TaxID=80872 RepID=A0ABP3EL26_9ACTN